MRVQTYETLRCNSRVKHKSEQRNSEVLFENGESSLGKAALANQRELMLRRHAEMLQKGQLNENNRVSSSMDAKQKTSVPPTFSNREILVSLARRA